MTNYKKLAKRATACKHWRWLPGMRYSTDSWRTEGFDRVPERAATVAYAEWLTTGRIPDLTDPCTLGGLLALVREARKDPTYLPKFLPLVTGARWAVEPISPHPETWYETEAAALIAALEAAP